MQSLTLLHLVSRCPLTVSRQYSTLDDMIANHVNLKQAHMILLVSVAGCVFHTNADVVKSSPDPKKSAKRSWFCWLQTKMVAICVSSLLRAPPLTQQQVLSEA